MCENEFKIAMQRQHFRKGDKKTDILLTRLTQLVH